MVDRREIITICRQIGNMMEAGVDILRITQVLRAQTDNARLLQIYGKFDHDLRMGASIAEAMTRASDIFSPFMITLVRQAEQRSDLETVSKHVAAAFLKIADFLQQDEDTRHASEAVTQAATQAASTSAAAPQPGNTFTQTTEAWPLTLRAIEEFTGRLQLIALRALMLVAGLLFALAIVGAIFEMGGLDRRWLSATLCGVSALLIGCAGVWARRQMENEKRQAGRCAFCSREGSAELPLSAVPGFPGAAICAQCATLLANGRADAETRSTMTTEESVFVPLTNPSATPAPQDKNSYINNGTKPANNASEVSAPQRQKRAQNASTGAARAGKSSSASADEVSYE